MDEDDILTDEDYETILNGTKEKIEKVRCHLCGEKLKYNLMGTSLMIICTSCNLLLKMSNCKDANCITLYERK